MNFIISSKLCFLSPHGRWCPNMRRRAGACRGLAVPSRHVREESFEAFLETKFPDSGRKAYYLMSIHDLLRKNPTEEIENLGWSKALELAKVARSEGRRFDSATWLHKAKESTKQELKEEVYKYFTGEDYEPYEMVYFKLFESQLPVVERALYVASRMVGTERSRGYCLELICADFLADRTEESTPGEILSVIHRLVSLLPPDYQVGLHGQAGGAELEPVERC